MAISLVNRKSSLRIFYEVGLNEKGEGIYRSKTYSNVKPEALEEDIYVVAEILAGLQTFPLARVTRADQSDLENIPGL